MSTLARFNGIIISNTRVFAAFLPPLDPSRARIGCAGPFGRCNVYGLGRNGTKKWYNLNRPSFKMMMTILAPWLTEESLQLTLPHFLHKSPLVARHIMMTVMMIAMAMMVLIAMVMMMIAMAMMMMMMTICDMMTSVLTQETTDRQKRAHWWPNTRWIK